MACWLCVAPSTANTRKLDGIVCQSASQSGGVRTARKFDPKRLADGDPAGNADADALGGSRR